MPQQIGPQMHANERKVSVWERQATPHPCIDQTIATPSLLRRRDQIAESDLTHQAEPRSAEALGCQDAWVQGLSSNEGSLPESLDTGFRRYDEALWSPYTAR